MDEMLPAVHLYPGDKPLVHPSNYSPVKAKSCLHSKEQSCVNRGLDLVTDSSPECRHLHLGTPEPKQMGSQRGRRGCLGVTSTPHLHPRLATKLMLVQIPPPLRGSPSSKHIWPLSIHSDIHTALTVCQTLNGKPAGAEESKTLETSPLKAPVVLFGKGMHVGEI